jgi:hypothetical protein
MSDTFKLINLTLTLQRLLYLRGANDRVLIAPDKLATEATELQRYNHALDMLYKVLAGFSSRKPEVQRDAELMLEQVIGMLWAWGLFTENKQEEMRENPDPESVQPQPLPVDTEGG